MTRLLKLEQQFGATKVFETIEGQKFPATVATFANYNDALAFIAAALPETQQGMTAELERWSALQGLVFASADEMLIDAHGASFLAQPEDKKGILEQVSWLSQFVTRWEQAERQQGEAFWNAPVVAVAPEGFTAAPVEFSDYPVADLPEMPEGFEDTSWHNDSAPSIESRALGLRVWIDYLNPSARELEDGERFTVQAIDAEGETLNEDDLLSTDEWADVLALIATRKEG